MLSLSDKRGYFKAGKSRLFNVTEMARLGGVLAYIIKTQIRLN